MAYQLEQCRDTPHVLLMTAQQWHIREKRGLGQSCMQWRAMHACMHACMELVMAGIAHITISSFAVSTRIRATHASSHRLGCGIASRQQLPLLPLLIPPDDAPQRSIGRSGGAAVASFSMQARTTSINLVSERGKGGIYR